MTFWLSYRLQLYQQGRFQESSSRTFSRKFDEIFHIIHSSKKHLQATASIIRAKRRLQNHHIVLQSIFQQKSRKYDELHWVKSAGIQSFSDPFFPAFRLSNAGKFIQSEWGKVRTRKMTNTDTFLKVLLLTLHMNFSHRN